MMNRRFWIYALIGVVLVASVVQAVTTNKWKTTCMAPNTPATAYLWNEPSNWDTEQVPAVAQVIVKDNSDFVVCHIFLSS